MCERVLRHFGDRHVRFLCKASQVLIISVHYSAVPRCDPTNNLLRTPRHMDGPGLFEFREYLMDEQLLASVNLYTQ